jgi:hypothetical protein
MRGMRYNSLSPSPHANRFIIGTAVVNTHKKSKPQVSCRDVLGAGSVLGHHPVTAALAAPHKWARVVNKNPDRQCAAGRMYVRMKKKAASSALLSKDTIV